MSITAKLIEREPLEAELVAQIKVVDVTSDYEGAYEFTPSDVEQIAPTAGKLLSKEIVIKPIPSYWGKITYNGTYIRVS